VVLGWLVLGAWVAAWALRYQLPLPFCLLRTLTGVPCPACGCTRSLAAWAHFSASDAFRFNPLFCLACLALAGWGLLGLADVVLGTPHAARLALLARRCASTRRLLALAGLNWLYLWLNLPK
jgi:hypothetical protein